MWHMGTLFIFFNAYYCILQIDTMVYKNRLICTVLYTTVAVYRVQESCCTKRQKHLTYRNKQSVRSTLHYINTANNAFLYGSLPNENNMI